MKVIDLTRELSADFLSLLSRPIMRQKKDPGIQPSRAKFLLSHRQIDTRLDAPASARDLAKTIDQLPLERLLREAVLLDLTGKKPKQLIDDEDLEAAEEGAGLSIRDGEVVIVHTGWEKSVHSKDYLFGHPGLSGNAAEFLEFKHVAGVAIDTPNLDHPDNKNLPAHSILLGRGIFIVENLCNLEKLDQERFRLITLPLRVRASWSPVRAVAILDESA